MKDIDVSLRAYGWDLKYVATLEMDKWIRMKLKPGQLVKIKDSLKEWKVEKRNKRVRNGAGSDHSSRSSRNESDEAPRAPNV